MRDLPDAAYGEQATFQEDQRGAPIAMANSAAPSSPTGAGEDGPPIVPFGAPTQYPDQPGQSGASMGPGFGPEALGLANPAVQLEEADLEKIRDLLPFLEYTSNLPGAMPSTRALVRRLKAVM